jgi:hypothetical protein
MRLYGVLDSIGICPIAFNAFEELKAKVKWSKSGRDGQNEGGRLKRKVTQREVY